MSIVIIDKSGGILGWKVGDFEGRGADFLEGGGRPGLRPVLPLVAQRIEVRSQRADSYLIPSPPTAVRQRHQSLSPTSRTPPTPDRTTSPVTRSGTSYREKQKQKSWAKPSRAKHGSCLREAEAAAPSAPGLRPALPLVAQRTEIRSRKSDSYLFSLRSYQSSAVAPNPAPNLPRPPDLR